MVLQGCQAFRAMINLGSFAKTDSLPRAAPLIAIFSLG
jgi:hypothetical protein